MRAVFEFSLFTVHRSKVLMTLGHGPLIITVCGLHVFPLRKRPVVCPLALRTRAVLVCVFIQLVVSEGTCVCVDKDDML